MFERIHESFLFHFPRNRRVIAYRQGVEAFLHGATKFSYAGIFMIVMLSLAGLIDVVEVLREIVQLNILVIGAFISGSLVMGLLSGGAAFRKWASNPDVMRETKPRGRPPKTTV